MVGVQLDLLILAPPIGFFPMVRDWLLRFSFSGEQQLRSNFLRLFIVARWFVPFWRDTCRAKGVFFDGARPHSGLFILQFYISVIVKVLCQNTKDMPTVDVGSGKLQNVKVKETGIVPLNLVGSMEQYLSPGVITFTFTSHV